MYRKTKLACSVAAVLASAISANSAFAQNAQPNNDVEVIEVSGIRSSVAKSMDVKRSSAGVVDAISAEDIGDFPDTNLAESLQRITGVSIDRSGGEGQLITVRGFGPQFNTVLVNGRQMASENDSRAFSFDTIASELVSSLDVHKTSTATMQSGGVGSTININTARPFALNGFKMAGSVKGVYDENSEETTPQFSGLISNTFNDDTFGVLLAVSHQERETRLNQAQMDGWLENVGVPNPVTQSGDAWTGNVFSPRNYDHKVTFEERTRTNANLVFQYAPNDKLVVTADALYSDFDVESEATSYGHWFTAPNIQGVGDDGSLFDENGNRRSPTVDANGTIVDLYQEVGLATDMHAKTFDRLTDTYAVGLNFDYQYSENLNLSFDLSHSEAEREANNGGGDQLSLIGYANRVRFQVDDNILPVASMFASPNDNIYSGQQELDGAIVTGPDGFPIYNPALTPDGVSNHLDEANSRAHVMLRRGWAVEDEVSQLRFDGEYVTDGSGLTEIRFGAQYSTETKSLTRWDNEGVGIHCTYCGYPDLPEIPAGSQYVFDAGSDFLSDVSGSGRMPTSWLAHDGEANFAFLESYYQSVNGESISFDAVRRNNSFEVEEDIISTYMEFDFEGEVADMFLSATAGVRYEMTDVTVNGTQAPITGLTILDQTEMLAGFGDAQSIATESDYDVLLPNFSVRLEITDDLIARFAASSTITRPTLNSMSPVTVITTTRQGGDLTSTSGNPALEPFKSDNLDLSLEYYYDEASYASIGYFRKLVSNFIVNSQEDKTFELADGSLLTDPSTGTNASAPDAGDDVAVFTNTLPNNGEDATVDGFEIALQHTFDNGFGVLANGTIVDSDAELDPFDINQVFALTGLSDSYNLVAFYETDDYQIRLAYNWRDAFVQSLTQGQGDGPTIVESYQQLDISGSYSVTDNVEIFFEGINLTEEFVHKRGRFSNHLLLVEDSGRRWAFGVRGNF
ncbi:TonB-dependent receptor [Alteromonas mediterranea]|uniref:TonB-dependent receptor n=1 Tax=Alteromonas mediterranea TaxID=314275 RepID=A0AAC9F7M2_9ALTE|nr:TonB-dependent receptor [Alteromonas mediterranea]AFV87317.1 TonB-dependent receptor [Alteromonas mediterranea DE1]AGP99333.1 TonB-dependent receptor [Alteromonas mediterranea UM7]AGQ03493.1 TonB-dependent receptor [Alteromonas mediterranea UM4b]AMJ80211.1 TonB-dependent receptor [Alteromonas mediterranea]AMJ84366.1 TonB-dependent receptor [Alteromonas mediterranea]